MKNRHPRIENKVGMKFGKWTVIEKLPVKRGKYYIYEYKCRCDCGKEQNIRNDRLCDGRGVCGCECGKLNAENETSAMKELYRKYKSNASSRGLIFSLSKKDFYSITTMDCAYCGESPKQIFKCRWATEAYFYNGIDRVDNSKGYIVENCVPCCKECNVGKHIKSKEDFLSWIYRVYKYNFIEVEHEINSLYPHF